MRLRQNKNKLTNTNDPSEQITEILTLKTSSNQKLLKLKNVLFKLDLQNIQEVWAVGGDYENSKLSKLVEEIIQWRITKLYLCKIFSKKGSNKNSKIVQSIQEIKFPRLKDLHLGWNLIESIEPLSRINLFELEELDLRDNRLTNVTPLRKCCFKKLKILSLRGNMIKEVNCEEWDFPALKKINISNEVITKIKIESSKCEAYLNSHQIEKTEKFSVQIQMLFFIKKTTNHNYKEFILKNSQLEKSCIFDQYILSFITEQNKYNGSYLMLQEQTSSNEINYHQLSPSLDITPEVKLTNVKPNREDYVHSSQVIESESLLTKEDSLNVVIAENKKLRISNKELRKQLELFERRLDDTLRKKTMSEKKPRVRQEVVESMELKNAYKQCDIYKREISTYKKRELMFDEQKYQDLLNRVSELELDKEKLFEEVKSLKKINRQQEKSLMELADTNFSKILKEFEHLKEENQKLNQKFAKEEREEKLAKISINNDKRKAKEYEQKTIEIKKKEEDKHNNQVDILKIKSDKDNKKIVYLISENNKYKILNEELNKKLEEKDKEMATLRERLALLRKEARLVKSRIETEPSANEVSYRTIRKDTSMSKELIKSTEITEEKTNLSQPNIVPEEKKTNKKPQCKYPRLIEAGTKRENSYKWNHHEFSSKIKEIQISIYPNKTIKELCFKYEKGEPTSIDPTSKFSKFTCEENTDEYIRCIKGGFKDQILRYLEVETSKGRKSHFGQEIIKSECITFCFGEGDKEFPGALFGENCDDGINRLGCLIECEK